VGFQKCELPVTETVSAIYKAGERLVPTASRQSAKKPGAVFAVVPCRAEILSIGTVPHFGIDLRNSQAQPKRNVMADEIKW
jgi:hypothetical protein